MMSQYMNKFYTSGVEDMNLAFQLRMLNLTNDKDSGDARKDDGNYEPDVENDEDDVKDDDDEEVGVDEAKYKSGV